MMHNCIVPHTILSKIITHCWRWHDRCDDFARKNPFWTNKGKKSTVRFLASRNSISISSGWWWCLNVIITYHAVAYYRNFIHCVAISFFFSVWCMRVDSFCHRSWPIFVWHLMNYINTVIMSLLNSGGSMI